MQSASKFSKQPPWTYDDATGLELSKRYADGSTVTKTYDSFGNPATETNARGIVTSYEYDSFRNLLLAIRYSDNTEDETFAYNHLGQLTQVTDAAGSRSIAYKAPEGSEGDWTMREAGLPRRGERPMGWARINRYGEAETDSLLAGSMTHTITEQRDTLGRSTGYVYAKNDIPQQQTDIGYGADGRITGAGFTHQGEHKEFLYSYLPGTHLLHTLTHPNGLTLTQSYDATRDLPTQMDYSRADALVVQRAYTYDLLGRPTARDLARYGTQTSDTFGYNTRSESPRGLGGGLDNARSGIAPKGRAGNGVPASQLTSAHVNSADYSYAYDAIGNRTSATEAGTSTAYTSNRLNQYTAEGSFRPTFDADGNQTLIKTSTGTWNVTYNAKNRPILFTKSDGSVTVECTYDTMGRRATKKVTTNGTLTEHRRFLYRGYLQIACCDLTRAYTPALWFILWDPTQETATRPLAIQKNGTWYTYGWDLTKNICETYRTDARIDLAYTYTPYGEVSPAHAYDQPVRWSSEYHDTESPRRLGGGLDKHEVFAPKGRAPKGVGASQLGLVYYNYRHYNPAMGRWLGRDLLPSESYIYTNNNPAIDTDFLGLMTWPWEQTQPSPPSAPIVIIEPNNEDEDLCSNCRKKLQSIKDYILRTYQLPEGHKCTIKLNCLGPTVWENPNFGAFYQPEKSQKQKKGYACGLISLPCNECKENIIRKAKSGAFVKYGFTDFAKHEIEHAIDYCKGNTSRNYIETRAYALHQVERGTATRQQYIDLIRHRVKAPIKYGPDSFSEDEFQRAIKDLKI